MPNDTNRRLSDLEVHDLLREYKLSRRQAVRDRIVMQYANLVESIARRFAGAAEPAEDLAQEGYIGLITAVDGYDADKGVKFSTYATHFIIGQIKHHLRDKGKIIKEPAWLQELNQKVTKIIESLSQELGRPPTNGEIAKLMGMQEEAIADLMSSREVFKVASLDGGSEQDDDSSPSYDMDRTKADKAVDFQLPLEEKLVLETALRKLKELEQAVVQEFYFRDRNQTEIARNMGISCNYVSHILRNSTKKLKKILVTDEIKEAQMAMSLVRRRGEALPVISNEQSVVDSQTRLYNRRYFDNRLEEELSRSSRSVSPLAVLLIELEGYEHITRAYGTLRAEETLRNAAGLIRSTVRKADIVTRFDVCTFGLLLPHTGSQVDVVARRLTDKLAEWLAENGHFAGRAPITLKAGWSSYPLQSEDGPALIELAIGHVKPVELGSRIALAA
jgi:RNA polymerase sigma-B factor